MELTRHITSAIRQFGLWVGVIILGMTLSLSLAPAADAQPTARNISVDIFDWYFINLSRSSHVAQGNNVPIFSGNSSIVVEYMFRFEDSNPNHAFDAAQRDGAGKWEASLGTLPDYYYCRHLTGGDDSGPCILAAHTNNPLHLIIPVGSRMYTETPWLPTYSCKEYSIVLGIWAADPEPSNPNNPRSGVSGALPSPSDLTHQQPNTETHRTSFEACIPGNPRTPSGLRLTEVEGTDIIRLTWNSLDTSKPRNIGYGEFVGYQVEHRAGVNANWQTVRRPFVVESDEHTRDGKNTTYETTQWAAGEQNSWRIRTVTRVKLRTSRNTARDYANTFAWDLGNRPSNNNVFPAPEFAWHYFFSDWDTKHWAAPTAGTPNRPPENFRARTNDDGNYVLTWEPPSNAASVGGITSYTLERLNDDGLVVDEDTTTITPPTLEHVFGEGDADVPALGSGYRWVLTGTGPNGTTPPARLTFGTHGSPRIPSVGGAVGGALSVRLNWAPAQGDRGDASIHDVQWRVRYRPTGNTTAWTVLPLFGNANTRSRTLAIPEIGIIVLELAAVNAAGIGGTATATPTVAKAGSVAPTLTDPETARHSHNSVGAELRGPTTVYLGSTVYYNVDKESNVRIGAAASNLTRTDPLNEISGNLTPINECVFNASPPPIICVIRPPGSTSFRFFIPTSRRNDYRVRYWFPDVINGTGDGVPKNHRLEIKVTPDRSHIGSTFDVGWHPQSGSAGWGEGSQDKPKITVTIAEPTGNPNPPHNLSVSVNGAGNYVLTWDAPILATAYGVDAYVVQPYVGGVKQPSHQITSRTYTQASTSANQVYAWTVKAKAGSDESVESERITEGLPNPPRDFSSLTGSEQMELSWRRPAASERGLPAESYTIDRYNSNTSQWEPLIQNIHIANTSYKLTDLTNGEHHRLTIVSVNGSHRSVRSGEVSDTPSEDRATVPSPPQDLLVETRDRPAAFSLIWSPPISDGRAPLTGYQIKLKVGVGATNPTSVGSTTETAFLVTSDEYSIVAYNETTVVQVIAVNAVGESEAVEVTAEIPAPRPSEPRLVVATTNRRTTALTWVYPRDNGGETITDYVVERRVNRENAQWTTIQSTDDNVTRTEYLDRQLQLGTTYEYRISAATINGTGPGIEDIVPTLAGIDFNLDGTVDSNDARIMYYANVLRDVVGDGGTGFHSVAGFRSFRNQLIAPVMGSRLTIRDADIDEVLAYANHWRQVGATQGGDFDSSSTVDQYDALILYYATEFATQLGDGTTGGRVTERRRLLGPLLSPPGGSTPDDEQLRSVLRSVHALAQ